MTTPRHGPLGVVTAALLVILACACAWVGWRARQGPPSGTESYNQALKYADAAQRGRAIQELEFALDESDFHSDVNVAARYNLAVLRAQEPSTKSLAQARGLLEDLLRQRPDDEDVRRNLEIVIAKMRALLTQDGMSPDSADQQLDARSEAPSTTEEPGAGNQVGAAGSNEVDY